MADVTSLNLRLGQQGIVAWPVAKLLEIVLGPTMELSTDIQVGALQVTRSIYRCAESPRYPELKELIAMHSFAGQHGGDLNTDTITIIDATLDLQEKVVRQVRTVLVGSPACFPPADTVHPGHDTDQRRLHALDRQ